MTSKQQDQTSVTLREIVAALEASEDNLAEIDPEVLVGTLNDKVDAIHFVLLRMEDGAASLRDRAKPLVEKAKALENARQRLRDYVVFTMQKAKLQKLPGELMQIALKSTGKRLSMSFDRQPTGLDAQQYRGLVKTVVSFEWDKDAIEALYREGKELPPIVRVEEKETIYPTFKPTVNGM